VRPPKPLIFCGCLGAVLWIFAAVNAVLGLCAYQSGGIAASAAFQEGTRWMATCASILIAAWTIGSVLEEKL
jgi:hypothetical protein